MYVHIQFTMEDSLSLLVKYMYMYLDAFKKKETYLNVTFITVYFISNTCTCAIVFDSDVQIKFTETSFK